MASNQDDTILPPRRPVNLGGMDGDTVVPQQNAAGIHVPGDVIDNRYTVIREIGRGGMGVVYEVLDGLTGDHYAVKKLLPELAQRPEIVAIFRTEGAASMRFTTKSPRFVTTQMLDMDGDVPYIVLQLIALSTLRSLMTEVGGKLQIDKALPVIHQIAEALSELHVLGYVHRDLKPENIFVDIEQTPPTVMLVDFGLTKDAGETTKTVMRGAGTERYASPEQKKGLPTNAASDVYAFGVIAFELLAGEAPGVGDTLLDFVDEVPCHVADLIMKCLATRSERRPQSASILSNLLSGSERLLSKRIPNAIPAAREMASDNTPKSIVLREACSSAAERIRDSYPELAEYLRSTAIIPSGTFYMGSSKYPSESPAHKVSISSFGLGVSPVTVALWQEYVLTNPGATMPPEPKSKGIDGGHCFNSAWNKLDHPIVCVNWNDCRNFCSWASNVSGVKLDLPSEAQWEYACRGGRSWIEFPWTGSYDQGSISEFLITNVWCSDSHKGSSEGTGSINRSKRIWNNHPYGLVDIIGNVWEWCLDYYDPDWYQRDSASGTDIVNMTSSQLQRILLSGGLVREWSSRCVRGGSWFSNNPDSFRSSCRDWLDPTLSDSDVGFRPAIFID